MLYDAYEVHRSLLAGASKLAGMGAGWLNNPSNPWGYSSMGPMVAASLEVFAHASAPRGKPEFGLDSTTIGRKRVRFARRSCCASRSASSSISSAKACETGPSLLIVAPMSGHYATLLRGTVERLLPRHDIYITDWRDAKLVPLTRRQLRPRRLYRLSVEFLELIGERTGERPHMLAVCQPAVPAFAADGADGADKNPWRPKTLTMMGGPIDTREAPTAVNTLATERPLSWFEQNVIATVPMIYAGRRAEGLSRLPAARRVHDHEPRLTPRQPLGDVQASRRRRRRRRGCDPQILRGISLGVRHDRRILSADGRRRVPAPFAAERRAQAPRQARRSRRDPRHRTARDRRRARRYLRASARPARRSTSRPSCRAPRSNISWPRTSAITASSTAANGARRSLRCSKSSSPPTPDQPTLRWIRPLRLVPAAFSRRAGRSLLRPYCATCPCRRPRPGLRRARASCGAPPAPD